MNIIENVNKLLSTKDEENTKLARNIIIQKVNADNVIAFICILKTFNLYEIITEDNELRKSCMEILAHHIKNENTIKGVNFPANDLFAMALQSFKSENNLKYARDYYIQYIKNLAQAELNILDSTFNMDTELFEV